MLNCGGVIILLSQFEGRKIPCIWVARGAGEHWNTLVHTHSKKLFLFATHELKLVPSILCMDDGKILTAYMLRKDEDFRRTLFLKFIKNAFAHKSLKFIDRNHSFEVSSKIPIGFCKFGTSPKICQLTQTTEATQ